MEQPPNSTELGEFKKDLLVYISSRLHKFFFEASPNGDLITELGQIAKRIDPTVSVIGLIKDYDKRKKP